MKLRGAWMLPTPSTPGWPCSGGDGGKWGLAVAVGVRQSDYTLQIAQLLRQFPGLPKGMRIPLGHCYVKVKGYLPLPAECLSYFNLMLRNRNTDEAGFFKVRELLGVEAVRTWAAYTET